ncbi:MAG: hypothetical protein ABSF64_35340 [Bryobacteraceae bacterium]|jgi:hypothetical protein
MPVAARKKKDPAAVALGPKGGKKGGPARAASMTPAQRSESARKAVQARWDKLKTKRRSDHIVSTMGTPLGMKTFSEFAVEPQGDGLFEIANISPKRTGLPFVVWISPRAGAPHDVRVKVSKGPKVHSSELVSVAISPDVQVVSGGKMTAHDLDLLKK